MMMAHDSGSAPPALDPETIGAVRAALVGYVRGGDSTPELQHALALVSREAHEKGILPERLLVMLKDIWNAIPEVRLAERARGTPPQHQLLQQVITRCIQQYYAE